MRPRRRVSRVDTGRAPIPSSSRMRRFGAPGGTRTPDARLRTAALYPLSYGGAARPSYPTEREER